MTPDEEKIIAAIPAEFHMISGSHDVQTSADVFNVNKVWLSNRYIYIDNVFFVGFYLTIWNA
jgi:hypothetical protein